MKKNAFPNTLSLMGGLRTVNGLTAGAYSGTQEFPLTESPKEYKTKKTLTPNAQSILSELEAGYKKSLCNISLPSPTEEKTSFYQNIWQKTKNWAKGFGKVLSAHRAKIQQKRILVKYSDILRLAAKEKGMFSLGKATRTEAHEISRAWVGKNFRFSENGRALISQDGLRQFRFPKYKQNLTTTQANIEWRVFPHGKWQANGHFDIID